MKDYTTNSIELEDISKRLNINLVGVFSKDKLPDKMFVGGYIINMENHDIGQGTHWTALYITEKNVIIYFDSFGLPPPREIKQFINYKPLAINTRQIQDINSTMCGYFCLMFLKYIETYKNHKKGLYEIYDDFLNLFRRDKKRNDEIVKSYFGLH